MTNKAMPTHLTGEMSDMWNKLREMAGENPDAAVKVTDAVMFPGIEALSAVGGCTFENAADGGSKEVKLLFAVEDVADQAPEVTAVTKAHKFAR